MVINNVTDVALEKLVDKVSSFLKDGYRFATITCVDAGDDFELFYHFDKDHELFNLRTSLPKSKSLPSITGICFAAILMENELKDFFGIKVDGLVVDFEGRMILSEGAPDAPMCKAGGVGVEMKIKEKEAK